MKTIPSKTFYVQGINCQLNIQNLSCYLYNIKLGKKRNVDQKSNQNKKRKKSFVIYNFVSRTSTY